MPHAPRTISRVVRGWPAGDTDALPSWIAWLTYLSPFRYALNSLMVNEFDNLLIVFDPPGVTVRPCGLASGRLRAGVSPANRPGNAVKRRRGLAVVRAVCARGGGGRFPLAFQPQYITGRAGL